MRTDQQGYLQRLGFRDADRNSLNHDRVCLFLADEKISKKMADYIAEETMEYDDLKVELSAPNHKKAIYYDVAYTLKKVDKVEKDAVPQIREQLLEIEDRLKKNLDYNLRIFGEVRYTDAENVLLKKINDMKNNLREENIYYDDVKILGIVIEVKTTKENITSILQQLNTYRTFEKDYFIKDLLSKRLRDEFTAKFTLGYNFDFIQFETEYVLVTTYPLDENEKKILKQQGYKHIFLNDLFEFNGHEYLSFIKE